jgi:hypothetical protein
MQQFIIGHMWLIYALVAWSIPWKGVALWKAAKNGSKVWFVIIFLINTLSILDIIYVLFLGKKKEEMPTFQNSPKILGNGARVV